MVLEMQDFVKIHCGNRNVSWNMLNKIDGYDLVVCNVSLSIVIQVKLIVFVMNKDNIVVIVYFFISLSVLFL